MKRFPAFPNPAVWIASVAIASLPATLPAAETGAWETFSTKANADAWTIYDFSDESEYYPEWWGDVAGEEYIYFYHAEDAPLWFYSGADENAGGGILVGDYAAEKIQAIQCDIAIDSLADFAEMGCAIYAGTGDAERYYYSPSFYNEDFDAEGWWTLRFYFDVEWFYFDGNEYQPTQLTPAILSSVQEIGFRFFPKSGTTAETFSALDNVKLVPTVDPVDLAVSTTGGEFRLTFTPGRGIACSIEKSGDLSAPGWQPIPGESSIIGTTEHVFATPLSAAREFFRVLATEHYTPFVTDNP